MRYNLLKIGLATVCFIILGFITFPPNAATGATIVSVDFWVSYHPGDELIIGFSEEDQFNSLEDDLFRTLVTEDAVGSTFVEDHGVKFENAAVLLTNSSDSDVINLRKVQSSGGSGGAEIKEFAFNLSRSFIIAFDGLTDSLFLEGFWIESISLTIISLGVYPPAPDFSGVLLNLTVTGHPVATTLEIEKVEINMEDGKIEIMGHFGDVTDPAFDNLINDPQIRIRLELQTGGTPTDPEFGIVGEDQVPLTSDDKQLLYEIP